MSLPRIDRILERSATELHGSMFVMQRRAWVLLSRGVKAGDGGTAPRSAIAPHARTRFLKSRLPVSSDLQTAIATSLKRASRSWSSDGGPVLDDAAALHNQDPVKCRYCRETMGDGITVRSRIGSARPNRDIGSTSRIACMPQMAARASCRLSSAPRPRSDGLKRPTSPPPQAQKDNSLSGKTASTPVRSP
jgi:hypothetical protein